MPYPRTKPYTEEEMFKEVHVGHHTICQTLRDIYVKTEDPETKEQLRLVFAFGKKMHTKLKEYRQRYDDEMKQVKYEEEI